MSEDRKNAAEIVRIPFDQMEREFYRVLIKYGFVPKKAGLCADLFAVNTLEGIYSHGVNRFPRFIQNVKGGLVRVDAEPEKKHIANALEQWDGCLGPGPLNALVCTERAMKLSAEYGIGCLALSNTNHWMRGGHYGWKAAKAGFVFIGWTNTIANMPAWGAVDCRLGNNPIVFAVPYEGEAIVLDMAMSQFSYGTMEMHQLQKTQLKLPGGYDRNGVLTTDPSDILESKRVLPIGYWKGSGMALLLDILAAILSGGLSTQEITKQGSEYGLSQVFIAVDISRLGNHHVISEAVNDIIKDYRSSIAGSASQKILYPGERVLLTRKENLATGIPVNKLVWEEVQNL